MTYSKTFLTYITGFSDLHQHFPIKILRSYKQPLPKVKAGAESTIEKEHVKPYLYI